MAWNPAVLTAAASRAGMLCPAVYQPAGAALAFEVSFLQPETLVLGDQRQVSDYEIEYPTAALPAQLRQGDQVRVTDRQGTTSTYRANAHARKVGDGYFSRCDLALVSTP